MRNRASNSPCDRPSPSYRLGYIGAQHGSDARFISAGLLGLVEEVEGLAFALTSVRPLR